MVEPEIQQEDARETRRKQAEMQLNKLNSNRKAWATLSPKKKLKYLEAILERLTKLDHDGWSKQSAIAQGYNPSSCIGSEIAAMDALVNVIITSGLIRSLIRTYKSLVKTGNPPQISKAEPTEKGSIAKVFPFDMKDKMSPNGIAGITVEIHSNAPVSNLQYKPPVKPELCLILGAGNQSFLAFGDVINKLFLHGQVCILKHHPVRYFSKVFYDTIFKDLKDDGYYWSTEGDKDHSLWLCSHPLVDSIHMTGGSTTHDAIIWGADPTQQERNKLNNTPVIKKPMTSELSAITPWLICPGSKWSSSQIKHHASVLAQAFVSQNSCNCLSPKVLILDQDWPQKEDFIEQLRANLKEAPMAPPYYPGTRERYEQFQNQYPAREEIKGRTPSELESTPFGQPQPWMLLHLHGESNRYGLTHEAFSPVLTIWSLSCRNNPTQFLEEATVFANEEITGTLSTTLVIHDDVMKAHQNAVKKAIQALRYGIVSINTWSATSYAISAGSWGAYPGEKPNDIVSGIGVVGNVFMVKDIEKTVLRAPFKHAAQLSLKEGRLPFSVDQLNSLKNLTLKPSLTSAAKFVKMMAFSGR